jgi:hypothetical protein
LTTAATAAAAAAAYCHYALALRGLRAAY